MKFIIDFGTMTEEFEGTLEEAKEQALNMMGHTERDVIIADDEGNEITRSQWFGVDGNDEEFVLEQFGSSGYYQIWSDELA